MTHKKSSKRENEQIHLMGNKVLMFIEREELIPQQGESIIAINTYTEDAKAHPGIQGQLYVLNTRIYWFLPSQPFVNVTIGYGAITHHSISEGNNMKDTIFIRTKARGKVFEFVFCIFHANNFIYNIMEKAIVNYNESSLFRELRLRSTFIKDGRLELLSGEQVIKKCDGVSNYSGDTAKLGTAIVTNIRFIWYAEIVCNFNVSVPLILLTPIKIQSHEIFGKVFHIRTRAEGSPYYFGFTIQPEDKLKDFVVTLEKIRISASKSPVLTTTLAIQQEPTVQPVIEVDEDVTFVQDDPSGLYLPIDVETKGHPGIVYEENIGLSIEELPKGVSLFEKWEEISKFPLVYADDL